MQLLFFLHKEKTFLHIDYELRREVDVSILVKLKICKNVTPEARGHEINLFWNVNVPRVRNRFNSHKFA